MVNAESKSLKVAKWVSQRIPGTVLILNVLVLIVLAIFAPLGFWIVSAPFAVFNLYMACKVGFFSTRGLSKFKRNNNKDYHKKYVAKKEVNTTGVLNWDDITHYVVIPNYKESIGTLQETLNTISVSKVAQSNIIVCLAMEERENGAAEKAQSIIDENRSLFKDMMFSLHPPDLPGEQKGKSSNEAWAAQKIFEDVKKRQLNRDHVIITIMDADSNMHPKHFDCLQYKFCTNPNRHFRVFQGPMVSYKNFHTTPVFTRLLSMVVSLHEIACLSDKYLDHHIPFSTYSISCTLAQNTGGWDTEVIPEDWRMYMKSFFNNNGKVKVEPIFLPVQCYAVESDNGWWASVKDRFVQAKRHSWGISEIGYYFYRVFETCIAGPRNKRPNLWKTFTLGLKACALHYYASMGLVYGAISGVLIAVYTWIPGLNDSPIAELNNGYWSFLFRWLNGFALIPIVIVVVNHIRLVQLSLGPSMYGKWIWAKAVQWVIELALLQMPTALVFACYPTFKAAIMQLWTDKLDYVVAARPTINVPGANDRVEVVVEGGDSDKGSHNSEEDMGDSKDKEMESRPLVDPARV